MFHINDYFQIQESYIFPESSDFLERVVTLLILTLLIKTYKNYIPFNLKQVSAKIILDCKYNTGDLKSMLKYLFLKD